MVESILGKFHPSKCQDMEYVYIMRAKYMRVCLLPIKDKEWAVNSIAMGICT